MDATGIMRGKGSRYPSGTWPDRQAASVGIILVDLVSKGFKSEEQRYMN